VEGYFENSVLLACDWIIGFFSGVYGQLTAGILVSDLRKAVILNVEEFGVYKYLLSRALS
jgi:hypothetical protein